MSKNKKSKKTSKFKASLSHLIRKFFEKNPDEVFSHKDIYTQIVIKDTELRKQAFIILKELALDGYLMEVGHAKFRLNHNTEYIEGEIQLTAKGVGFLLGDKKGSDIYIAPNHTNQAMTGDQVKVAITKKGLTRTEGQVV